MRPEVVDVIKQIPYPAAILDAVVSAHRYQLSFQGCIVDDEIDVPLLPTAPVERLKFAYELSSLPPIIWAKTPVPARKNTENVLVFYGAGNVR